MVVFKEWLCFVTGFILILILLGALACVYIFTLCVSVCVCVRVFVFNLCMSYFCPDGVSPLSASDELTQHYQSLVQVSQQS